MRVRRRAVVLCTTLVTVAAVLLSVVHARADPGPEGRDDLATYHGLFSPGPEIGQVEDYVSQGIAYWPARDAFVLTYYDADESEISRLSVVGRATGQPEKHVAIAAGHVGEAVISHGYLWVSDLRDGENWVRRYGLTRLAEAADGSYLAADRASFPVQASASIAAANGDLYVGSHTRKLGEPGHLYRYDVSAAGDLSPQPVATSRIAGEVQGIEFSGRYTFYSQSYGRREQSRITVVDRVTGRSTAVQAPSMSEGLTVADGRLYVTYESAARRYRGHLIPWLNAKNPTEDVHSASTSELVDRL